ncbi:MAG: YigZ family protein [Nannocystaceae bacterium]|nr:YigZ family protein [Myxococcales bacterium]
MVEVRTIASRVRLEIEKIEGSRFIATAAVAASAGHAAAFVEGVRAEFEDATHHCWAFRGRDRDTFRYVDDGEPSGSAGKPILNAIDGRSLADVVVVVTRYFGGVKLGTGGLVRAYGRAAAEVLDSAEIITRRTTRRLSLRFSYRHEGAITAALSARGIEPAHADYGAVVELHVDVPEEDLAAFRREVTDRCGGKIELRTLD